MDIPDENDDLPEPNEDEVPIDEIESESAFEEYAKKKMNKHPEFDEKLLKEKWEEVREEKIR